MTFWTEVVVILALILLSGVFAGAEIALLSVRKTRLGELMAEGHRGARAAVQLRKDPERLLATIQVAITVLGAATAVFGGSRLEEPLSALLVTTGLDAQYAQSISFVIVVSGISYFSLVFGELVPKSIALRKSEAFSLVISGMLVTLSKLAKPAVWLLTFSSNVVLRPFRDSTNFTEAKLSPEELQQLVEEASTQGTLPEAAGEIASRAIDLAHLRVKDVMIPRRQVFGLSVRSSRDEARAALRDHPFNRYPVYDKAIDDVLGYVTARELYESVLDQSELDLRSMIRPLLFLPETTHAVAALRRLQQERQRLALVVDETGGVVGAVTIADVAEELIGDVLDENEAADQSIQQEPGGSLLVRGETPIHELERVLDLDLALDGVRASTVAGLVIEQLGRIPQAKERVGVTKNLEAEILDATERRVRVLRLRKLDSGERPEETET